MTRIHVICEGATEEFFINEVLGPHLMEKKVYLKPSQIGRPGKKGGNVSYARLFTELRIRLKGDKQCWCTTMLDYYGLPSDFPGKSAIQSSMSAGQKGKIIVEQLREKVEEVLGDDAGRFIPYVQMYEFEGLLFSNPKKLSKSLNLSEGKFNELQKVRDAFDSPEYINDSPITAPSKRLQKLHPGYDKPVAPLMAVREIGLSIIRQECKLFDQWVSKLESLA